jgi:hypothetical protein
MTGKKLQNYLMDICGWTSEEKARFERDFYLLDDPRARCWLIRNRIKTLAQLAAMSDTELWGRRLMGPKLLCKLRGLALVAV